MWSFKNLDLFTGTVLVRSLRWHSWESSCRWPCSDSVWNRGRIPNSGPAQGQYGVSPSSSFVRKEACGCSWSRWLSRINDSKKENCRFGSLFQNAFVVFVLNCIIVLQAVFLFQVWSAFTQTCVRISLDSHLTQTFLKTDFSLQIRTEQSETFPGTTSNFNQHLPQLHTEKFPLATKVSHPRFYVGFGSTGGYHVIRDHFVNRWRQITLLERETCLWW